MILVIKALIVGIVFGLTVSYMRLPIPAPPSIVGVAGIFGVYLGYVLFEFLSKRYS